MKCELCHYSESIELLEDIKKTKQHESSITMIFRTKESFMLVCKACISENEAIMKLYNSDLNKGKK